MEQQTRRVRAGQPPADIEYWEDDLNEMPEEPLSDAIAAGAVLIIMVIIGACAALIAGVI